MKEYQVTIIDPDNKYRPVSTIVKVDDNFVLTAETKKCIIDKGIKAICIKRYWDKDDLKKSGYTRVKMREYDRKKIEAENKARYEAIKEAKYASGEWKRPKGENNV